MGLRWYCARTTPLAEYLARGHLKSAGLEAHPTLSLSKAPPSLPPRSASRSRTHLRPNLAYYQLKEVYKNA